MLISFFALICFILMIEQIRSNTENCKTKNKKKHKDVININEALNILRSIKCKTYNDNKDYMVLELTKQQQNVLSLLDVTIPG